MLSCACAHPRGQSRLRANVRLVAKTLRRSRPSLRHVFRPFLPLKVRNFGGRSDEARRAPRRFARIDVGTFGFGLRPIAGVGMGGAMSRSTLGCFPPVSLPLTAARDQPTPKPGGGFRTNGQKCRCRFLSAWAPPGAVGRAMDCGARVRDARLWGEGEGPGCRALPCLDLAGNDQTETRPAHRGLVSELSFLSARFTLNLRGNRRWQLPNLGSLICSSSASIRCGSPCGSS